MMIIKTIKGAMLQDTIRGQIYTSRSPHLTEMNPFVESFLNSSTTGVQGGKGVKRPKQLLVLVNSDACEDLNPNVTDDDLKAAWHKFTDSVRKEAGGGREGNKAVDALTDEQWAEFAKDWVSKNKGGKKAKAAADSEGTEEGGTGEDGEPKVNQGGRRRG